MRYLSKQSKFDSMGWSICFESLVFSLIYASIKFNFSFIIKTNEDGETYYEITLLVKCEV